MKTSCACRSFSSYFENVENLGRNETNATSPFPWFYILLYWQSIWRQAFEHTHTRARANKWQGTFNPSELTTEWKYTTFTTINVCQCDSFVKCFLFAALLFYSSYLLSVALCLSFCHPFFSADNNGPQCLWRACVSAALLRVETSFSISPPSVCARARVLYIMVAFFMVAAICSCCCYFFLSELCFCCAFH